MIITEKLIKEVLPVYSASIARFILGEDCDNGGNVLEDIILSDNKDGDKRYMLFSVLGHLLYHDSFTKEDSERIFESLKELRKKSALPVEHGHFVWAEALYVCSTLIPTFYLLVEVLFVM